MFIYQCHDVIRGGLRLSPATFTCESPCVVPTVANAAGGGVCKEAPWAHALIVYWDHLRNILMGGTMWHNYHSSLILIDVVWWHILTYRDILLHHIITSYYVILLLCLLSMYVYVILLLMPSSLRECWMHLVVARLAKAKRFYHSPPVPLNVLLGILSRWGIWRLEDREPELLDVACTFNVCVLEGNHTVWVHHQQTLEVNYI